MASLGSQRLFLSTVARSPVTVKVSVSRVTSPVTGKIGCIAWVISQLALIEIDLGDVAVWPLESVPLSVTITVPANGNHGNPLVQTVHR